VKSAAPRRRTTPLSLSLSRSYTPGHYRHFGYGIML
jgi:hypothetical protein